MSRKIAIVALAAVWCWACSGDETGGGTTDAGNDSTADVGDAGGDAAEDCTGVIVADSPGADCSATGLCAEGLQCTEFDEDPDPRCRQVCVPETCESVCVGDEVCAPLVDAPGTGVCAVPAPGGQQAYEVCSNEAGRCADGLACIVGAEGATEGVCVPECTGDACEPIDGREGQCVIRVGDVTAATHCAPACSAEDADDECPGSMECFASAGSFVCVFPQ